MDESGLNCLREIKRFQSRLSALIQPMSIPEWLDTPNELFGGVRPLEVIERGDMDRFWSILSRLTPNGIT